MPIRPAPIPPRRPAFTLVEVLVTVASLVIVLGLMASLARYVRRQASEKQTKVLLLNLTELLNDYVTRNDRLPKVTPFLPGLIDYTADGSPSRAAAPMSADTLPDEPILREAARANNRDIVAALRTVAKPSADLFAPLANAGPGDDRLPDAWGRDIVFMPRGHPAIGTALQDRPFFFSAGQDGQYHTLEDNVYSYEIAPADRKQD